MTDEEWCCLAAKWQQIAEDLQTDLPGLIRVEEKIEKIAARMASARAVIASGGIDVSATRTTEMKEVERRIARGLDNKLNHQVKEEKQCMQKDIDKLEKDLNRFAITEKMEESERKERIRKMDSAEKAALLKSERDEAFGIAAAIIVKEEGISVGEYKAGIDRFLTKPNGGKVGNRKGKKKAIDDHE
ncbi:uncharacterized protein EAF02_011928 [Botrytis sinoallii]|uniref:uncharacterized protein n=1 Tax=Botrytis sinoallii TaxID=1463999 RepID=UPI00190030B3|nr:uncharacterized protein EAF02_011928 [Botrytis sinoallii]KAF7853623.1 hypothetical protein EAF02_011928 [Botrytis sinoallii]